MDDDGNVVRFHRGRIASTLGEPPPPDPPPPIDVGGGGPHPADMDLGWRSSVDTRLGELRGSLDGLRHSFTLVAGAVALTATLMVAGFAFLGFQLAQVSAKFDAIPRLLAEEFRAMRAETAAQTNAIANSITAARQIPSQIIVVPSTPGGVK